MRLAMIGCGLALLAGLAAPAAADEKKEIVWAKSLDAALKEAKASNKLVMIDVYTDWCGWCKELDKRTYSSAKVVEYAAKELVAVKVNAEKDGGEEIAKKYKVDGFPAIIFLSGDAEVVGRIGGFLEAGPFLTKTGTIVSAQRDLPGLLDTLKKEPGNVEALTKATTLLAAKGDGARAAELLAKAEKAGSKPNDLARAYNAVADVHQEEQQFDQAVMLFRKAAASSDPHEKAYALSSIAACFLSQNQPKKALTEVKAALAVPNIPADVKKDADRMFDQINKMVAASEEAEAGAKKAAELLKWRKNLEEALSDAKQSNKLVMADFYTDWCHWCKELDKNTYSNEATAKTIARYCVSVKIDAESKDGGQDAAQKYKVSGFPTILFLDGDGNVVGRVSGFLQAAPFAKKVEGIAKGAKEFPAKLESLKKDPGDIGAIEAVATGYADRGEGGKAKDVLEKARATKADSVRLDKLTTDVGEVFARSGDFKSAKQLFTVAAESKDAAIAAKARFFVAQCLLQSRDVAGATSELEKVAASEGAPQQLKSQAKQILDQLKKSKNDDNN